ncbi:unnamed protein product [Closterium sp. NIES-54]
MDIVRTSMNHALAPHFLWPYALCYATHQLNLQPRVSWPEVSPTSLWTGVLLHPVRMTRSPGSPSPLFLAPSPPPACAPLVPPPPPGPTPSGVSHATPLPSVARQVASPSPRSSSQSLQQPLALPRHATVDSVGVGAEGAATGGTRSGGASSRGAGTGDASAGGASSGGAGGGGTGTGGASSGGAGAGGTHVGGASTEETGAGGSPTTSPTAPIGPAAAAAAADAAAATFVADVPSSEWPLGPWSSFLSSYPLPVTYCTNRCPAHARPSYPLADLRIVLFRSPPRCSSPVCVLPSPPESSLIVSSHPITDYYHAARPVVSRVPASLVTDPRAPPSSVSALTAAVADFASTRRLDYATRVVAAPPPRPLSVRGESALGCDVLDFLAVASPSLCAMLLSLEGDPDALDIPIPRSYREAMSGKWASQWKAAMDAELASLRSTGTYVDAVPPPRTNVADVMWLFKVKQPPGSPPVFKAHYVARGFSQRERVDFFQTFAPTPKMTTLRVLLHVAAQRDYELHSLDFSTAFLQSRLHEEILLHCPPGFNDTFPPGTQWSLRRPVYGLRQSPCEWHDTLRSTLCDLGFRPSSADPSLFVRTGSTSFFILVYVDDLVLRRFGFQFSTTQLTPLAIDHRLTGPFPDEPFESSGPYAVLVGCLMYLMTCTRPNLAFPLSVLSRFVVTWRHRPVHSTTAVTVAKYLATTSGMGLVLGGTQPIVLTNHYDSSYADDVETQRSTPGYYFSLGAGAMS